MQKLNGREIYVLVILGITTSILIFLTLRDIFADISSVNQNAEGLVSIREMDLRTHIKAALQVILNLIAFICFWRKKTLGWILTFSIMFFYAFIICYVMIGFGFVDMATTVMGVSGVLIFLVCVIFLVIPSTIRKFMLKKTSGIGVLVTLGMLVLLYFGFI